MKITLPENHNWKSIPSEMADTDSFECTCCEALFHVFHEQDGTFSTEFVETPQREL